MLNKAHAGIDVSHWQGEIDFQTVRNLGVEFVYIKATEGVDFIDPNLETNYQKAKAAKLKIGFYHYVMARTVEEADEEAMFFYSMIKDKEYQGCPAMDFEDFGGLTRVQVNDIAEEFIMKMITLTGHSVTVYTDQYNAANVFDKRLSMYPLWIAEYNVTQPTMENPWSAWSGWQFTNKGHIDGIHDEVDLDYFRESILTSRSSVLVHK